jgi:hypothetical protein
MVVLIEGLKLRAVTSKLCDFLGDVNATMVLNTDTTERIDIAFEVQANCDIEFISDDKDMVVIRTIKRGKKLTYTFDCVDIDKVMLM